MNKKRICKMSEDEFAWLLIENIDKIKEFARVDMHEFFLMGRHICYYVEFEGAEDWSLKINDYGRYHWKTRVFDYRTSLGLDGDERMALWEDLKGAGFRV